MAGWLTILSVCVWSFSVFLCLVMSLHTCYVLPLHLYYRFVLNIRTSKLWSEVFRFSFAVTSFSYCVFRLVVIEPDGKGALMDSVRSCTVITYGTSTLFSLSLWSLVGFFTTKVTIAQQLRKMLGFPRLKWVKVIFLISHVVCAGLMITYLISMHPSFRKSNYGVYDCRSSAGIFSSILEWIVLVVQISLVYIFVDSMRLVYIGQREMFGSAFADVSVHSNERQILDDMREVVRVNAVWCLYSILSMISMNVIHLLFWKWMIKSELFHNMYVLIIIIFLSLNNLVLARVQSWRELYGYWIAYYSEEYLFADCIFTGLDICCFDYICCCVSKMERLLSIADENQDNDNGNNHNNNANGGSSLNMLGRSNRSLHGNTTTVGIGGSTTGFVSRLSTYKRGRKQSKSWFRNVKRTSILLDNEDMHIRLLSDETEINSAHGGSARELLYHHRSYPPIAIVGAASVRETAGVGSEVVMTGLTREHTASMALGSDRGSEEEDRSDDIEYLDHPSSAPVLADNRSLTQIDEPFDFIGNSFIRRISD